MVKKVNLFIAFLLMSFSVSAKIPDFSAMSSERVAEFSGQYPSMSMAQQERFIERVSKTPRVASFVIPKVYPRASEAHQEKLIDGVMNGDESYKMTTFLLRDYLRQSASCPWRMSDSTVRRLMSHLESGLKTKEWKPNYCEVELLCDNVLLGYGVSSREGKKLSRSLLKNALENTRDLVSQWRGGFFENEDDLNCMMYMF